MRAAFAFAAWALTLAACAPEAGNAAASAPAAITAMLIANEAVSRQGRAR